MTQNKNISQLLLNDYTTLSRILNDDKYFCTFDMVCRDSYAEFRSCEQGLSACVMFQSKHEGVFVVKEDQDEIMEVQVSSGGGMKRV